MKCVLVLLSVVACASAQQKAKVPECFKVHSMIRADEDHYWANWTNKCPFTIDSVYVMVAFGDESRQSIGNGVWALYFITPGAHRVIRFSTPPGVSDYQTVKTRKITTDPGEALVSSPQPAPPVSAERVGDLGPAGPVKTNP